MHSQQTFFEGDGELLGLTGNCFPLDSVTCGRRGTFEFNRKSEKGTGHEDRKGGQKRKTGEEDRKGRPGKTAEKDNEDEDERERDRKGSQERKSGQHDLKGRLYRRTGIEKVCKSFMDHGLGMLDDDGLSNDHE